MMQPLHGVLDGHGPLLVSFVNSFDLGWQPSIALAWSFSPGRDTRCTPWQQFLDGDGSMLWSFVNCFDLGWRRSIAFGQFSG